MNGCALCFALEKEENGMFLSFMAVDFLV